jgi:hypothetical protein
MRLSHPTFKAKMMNDYQPLDKTITQRRLDYEIMNNQHETSYTLLVRSEEKEKGRSIMEAAIYALLSLSVVISIFQFAHVQDQLPMGVTTELYHIQHMSHHQMQARPDWES